MADHRGSFSKLVMLLEGSDSLRISKSDRGLLSRAEGLLREALDHHERAKECLQAVLDSNELTDDEKRKLQS